MSRSLRQHPVSHPPLDIPWSRFTTDYAIARGYVQEDGRTGRRFTIPSAIRFACWRESVRNRPK